MDRISTDTALAALGHITPAKCQFHFPAELDGMIGGIVINIVPAELLTLFDRSLQLDIMGQSEWQTADFL